MNTSQTSLHSINEGINPYCGPAVLSALTGESVDKCAAVISAVSGKREIKAVQREHLKEALKRLRFDVIEPLVSGSTLYGTLFNLRNNSGKYVVFVHKHVVAIEVTEDSIFICDNHSKNPLDVSQSARLTQKVELVWKVQAKDIPIQIGVEIAALKVDKIIYINKKSKYKNSEDDFTETLGRIYFRDEDELKMIISAITQKVSETR